jgi:LysM repeat protein
MRGRARLARYAAPAAFLAAATIAVVLVRAGLEDGEEPRPAAATTTQATTTAPVETSPPTTGGTATDPAGAEFYAIQSGDTLADVAERFDTTVEQLLVLNPDVDPVALRIGQRIRVK